MARRRTRRRSSSAPIVRTISSPAPIIRVSAPRAAPRHHRRRGGGKGGKSLTTERMFATALGGAVLGFVDKSFPSLPTIPLLGRAGTIAAIAYFFGKNRGGIIRDVALAGASIAGYQVGLKGNISGDLMGDLSPQVSGVAAQV